MEIILIPGMWLDGPSWSRVVPLLEQAGHRAHALTLPGMESKQADRSKVTRQDHVAAVVAAIDATDPAGGKVAVVGHSAGGAIGWAATDARPDRVARLICVGGFPLADGVGDPGGYPVVGGEVPLPDWSAFDEADLVDLDEAARAEFRERAIPSPEHAVTDPQRLTDQRRFGVPVTIICTEFTSDLLRGWVAKGMAPVREIPEIRDVTYVDLPTGHWPQFTKPDQLAREILASLR